MQHLLKVPFIRKRLYARAVQDFVQAQEAKGIALRNEDIPERLEGVRTVLIDAALVMEGDHRVRRVCAPLTAVDPSRLKHQGAWMVLAAGISLGCAGYAPLERFVKSLNFAPERMVRQFPMIRTIPYDDTRRVDTTVHRDANGLRAYAKGDAEAILARCTHVLDGKERPLEDADREAALRIAGEMEADGLETLAFATRWQSEPGAYEEDMVFLGIVGMGDEPAPEAPGHMEAFRQAGLRPVLVAGTALASGAVRTSGMLREGADTMDAGEMDAHSDDALRDAAGRADAFLGLDWQRRQRLSRALRAGGAVAYLTRQPDDGRIILAMGDGKAPDAVFDGDGLPTVLQLVLDCRALAEAYRAE